MLNSQQNSCNISYYNSSTLLHYLGKLKVQICRNVPIKKGSRQTHGSNYAEY